MKAEALDSRLRGDDEVPAFHLAQVNVAYALGGPDDPVMADFNARLDEINQLADASPGFVWRYVTDSRDIVQREFEDPRVLFNMSVWDSVEALHAYAYRTQHGKVFAARRKWFGDWKECAARVPELGQGVPAVALWWVRAGDIPLAQEGIRRLRLLGTQGPHREAFTFKQMFSPDGAPIER
jgi:heme-degrading monooxygenase HmoA